MMRTILHYTGYTVDGGGIMTVIRNLAATGRFRCVLGINPGFQQRRAPALETLELPRVEGEQIGPGNFWRTRAVARAVQAWLRADATRVFHGHSRAGLLVGLWLHRWGERRVVVSVHCYGRQRWFYRWAASRLGSRLFWLSPAMRDYHGLRGDGWSQCVPGGVPSSMVSPLAAQPGRLRLGGIGVLVRWKGWHTIVEALGRLPADLRSQATFEHIGAGDEGCRAELLELVRKQGTAGQVKFCGTESSSERLLGAVDALVVGSVNEPFSVAMLEALAAGVPVIAADSGGAIDVIRPGVNGACYRTGDPAALAELITAWLRQPPAFDRKEIQRSAPRAEDVAARWAEIYAAL